MAVLIPHFVQIKLYEPGFWMERHQDFNLEYKVYAEKLYNNYIMKVLMEVFQLNTKL